ncbi:hypothetical protein CIB84_005855 [Bambusicola thoracicus]|uniref:Uncharacterized protein n=1 Tax=Bambusicola thoracicus TaxID=9083 RepID=A0A2P4T229_BAMTH|nr:hypothetical protein CIB84_005855 [Bambusicola thoracicus]
MIFPSERWRACPGAELCTSIRKEPMVKYVSRGFVAPDAVQKGIGFFATEAEDFLYCSSHKMHCAVPVACCLSCCWRYLGATRQLK